MCLELEANAEQNQGYETRSRNLPDGHRSSEVILSNEKMSLTDMVDSKVLTRTASKTENDNTGSVIKNEQIPVTSKEGSETHKTCPICQKALDDEQAFTTHIKRHKESNESNICQVCCKKLSSPSSLDRHMLVHTGERPFKCELCPVAFTTNGNMHRHMRTHAGEKRKSVNGNDGEQVISKKRKLINESINSDESERAPGKRKLTFEKNDSNDGDILEPKRQVYKTSNEENSHTFKCPVCSMRFISAESLDAHMNDHPNDLIECHRCGKVSENYACYKNHTCPKLQACDIDLQNLETRVGFRDLAFIEFSSTKFPLIAKITCEAEPRCTYGLGFECKSCSKIFPCSRSVELHSVYCTNKNQLDQKFTNEKSPGDQCTSQKDDFFEKLGLKRVQSISSSICLKPLQIVHDNVLPKNPNNEISLMDQEVPNNSKHDCHIENNSDFAEIPDIVSLASKASIPNLSSPIIAVTASPENSESENSVSPIVEDSVSSNSSSENTNEDSDIQNITSNNKNDILSCDSKKISKKRLKIQNSNRPYSCDFCSYLCSDKSTYVRHMRKHNGERPFICSLCSYAFTTKANSCRHVQTKHQFPKEKAASVIQYNPNMPVTNSAENMTSDNSKETVCKYCHEDFKFPRVLRHHVRSKFCLSKPYACQNCKLGFSTKNNCIRHITQKHPEYKDNVQELIVINKQSTRSPQELYEHSESNGSSREASNIDTTDVENSENESPDIQNNLVELDNVQSDTNEHPNITDNENQSVALEPNIDKHICIQYQSENQNSPCKEMLSSRNSDSSEEDRVSIAQSLVCLSESIPLEGTEIDSATSDEAIIDCSVSGKEVNYFVHEKEISDETEALDLTIRAIDLSSNNVQNNAEQPERQVTIHSSCASNSSISTNKTSMSPPPAHSSPVMSVVLDFESHLNNSNSAHLIRHDQNEITYVHLQAAHIPPVMNRFTDFENGYCSINLTQEDENQTMPYLTEQPVPAHSSSTICTAIPLENQQTNSFSNNILIKRDQSTYIQPMPAHSSPVISKTVENQLHGVAAPDRVQEEEKQSISCYSSTAIEDISAHSLPSFTNTTRPIFLNNMPSSSSASYTFDALHNPVRNEANNLNVSTKKQIQCEYCPKIFTLKSNKDRHVKNIHPEFAKPTQSRNSIGLKPEKDILKQVQNVSDKTKDRLRSVLIPKVNVLGKKSDGDAVDFEDKLISTIRSGTIPEESNENSSQIIENNDLQGQNSRSDFDLASVSSVINTANSKEIKKYLTNANVSDKFLLEKNESVSDSEMEQVNNAYGQFNGKIKEKYSCPQCHRGFPYKSSLQRHECTHTGAKSFTCPNCLTSCSTKSNLQRHLKNKCRMHILKSAQNFHEQNEKTLENAKNAELDARRHIAQFPNINEQSESSVLSHQAGSYAVNNFPPSIFNGPTTTSSSSTLEAISLVASMALQKMKIPSSSFECEFCETTYKTEEDLTNHVKELHPSEYASLMR